MATINCHLRKLLRGSRSFDSREEYVAFVEDLVKRANDNRRKNFLDDLAHLNRLPDERLDTDDLIDSLVRKPGAFANYRTTMSSFVRASARSCSQER